MPHTHIPERKREKKVSPHPIKIKERDGS